MLTKNEKDYAKVIAWLEKGEYDCMVTFTFPAEKLEPTKRNGKKRKMRNRLSDEFAEKCLGKFVSRYMKAIYPRKSKKKVIMAPFLERTTLDEPHFHILFRLGEDVEASKTLLRDIWVNVAPRICGDPLVHDKEGDEWFKEITNPEHRRRMIEYVTKWRTNLDGLVLKYTHLGPVNDQASMLRGEHAKEPARERVRSQSTQSRFSSKP